MWRTFSQNRLALAGLVLVALFGLMALLHPILLSTVWPPRIYDPETGYDAPIQEFTVVEEVADPASQISLAQARFRTNPFVEVGDTVEIPLQPAPPSWRHLLGTDFFGRDVVSMLMASAGNTFLVGLVAALTTAVVGTAVAALSAYQRGAADAVLSRVSDVLLLLPAPIFMVVLGASPTLRLGAVGFGVAYGLVAGAGAAAIVLRSHALTVMARPFIDAARVAGAGRARIVLRHLVPHMAPLAAAHMLVAVTGAVVADGFLAFAALSDERFNWGTMIYHSLFSQTLTPQVPWNVLVPAALAISLFCAAFYLVSLGLRDIADPSLQEQR
ncbi:MAG: ABC transporter permease [Actinomycetota bacterium]